jgi:hypothetical protein
MKALERLQEMWELATDDAFPASTWAEVSEYAVELRAALSQLLDQTRWRSVEEELPGDDREVLAFTNDGEYYVATALDGKWRADSFTDLGETATHWQPLPPAPEEKT